MKTEIERLIDPLIAALSPETKFRLYREWKAAGIAASEDYDETDSDPEKIIDVVLWYTVCRTTTKFGRLCIEETIKNPDSEPNDILANAWDRVGDAFCR